MQKYIISLNYRNNIEAKNKYYYNLSYNITENNINRCGGLEN